MPTEESRRRVVEHQQRLKLERAFGKVRTDLDDIHRRPGVQVPDELIHRLDSHLDAQASRSLLLTAAGGTPTTTTGCTKEQIELASLRDMWSLTFADAAASYAFWRVPVPANWDGRDMELYSIHWSSASSSTNSVEWGLLPIAYADGDDITATLPSFDILVDVANGGADIENISIVRQQLPIHGSVSPAAREIYFLAARSGAATPDNLAASARLHHMHLHYGTVSYSDIVPLDNRIARPVLA